MDAAVIDTDVLSYLVKHDTRAIAYSLHLDGRVLIISFMTIAEIDLWRMQRNWGPDKTAALEESLRGFSIYHSSRPLSRVWAEITDAARRLGRRINVADAWIAA